jgi:hypothetical protein
MKKFKLIGSWKEITGLYLGVQLVPKITMERHDLEYKLTQENVLHLIYADAEGTIWEEEISYSDKIEFL